MAAETEESIRTLPPYLYQDLVDSEDTRLLSIQPGINDEPLECKLSHVTLSEKPEYECLSYTWGDVTNKYTLRCEDGTLEITSNLHLALLRLRYPDRPRTLWVDAICIDQANIPHRNSQVERMSSIYAGALRVVVWLGEEDEGDKCGFDFINRFYEVVLHGQGIETDEGNSNLVQKGLGELAKLNMDTPESAAVSAILQRPWFRRVWVIQEVALAANAVVICGTLSAKWSAFASMLELVERQGLAVHLRTTGWILRAVSLMTNLNLKSTLRANPTYSFLHLLELTQVFSSTEPADRIFGLFAIASDVHELGLTVDYTQTCEELYRKFAIHQLFVVKNLHCVSFCKDHGGSTKLVLPSWVADWSVNSNPYPISSLAGQGFTAAGNTSPNLSLSADESILTVQGYVVEIVDRTNTIPMIPPVTTVYDWEMMQDGSYPIQKAIDEAFLISEIGRPYPNGEDFDNVFWRAFICDRLATGGPPPDEWQDLEPMIRYFAVHADDMMNERWDTLDMQYFQNGENLAKMNLYSAATEKWASGRNICATKDRYIGWVPFAAKAGDQICIFEGGEVPYVLRPREDGTYQILGDCFIHGIMEGQAMERGLTKQEFRLT